MGTAVLQASASRAMDWLMMCWLIVGRLSFYSALLVIDYLGVAIDGNGGF